MVKRRVSPPRKKSRSHRKARQSPPLRREPTRRERASRAPPRSSKRTSRPHRPVARRKAASPGAPAPPTPPPPPRSSGSGISPVLEALGLALDTTIGVAWRFRLSSLSSRLSRTRDDGKEEIRARRALDWLVRSFTPSWIESAGIAEPARLLRELEPITNAASAQKADAIVQRVLEQVQQDAQAASQELAKPLLGLSGPPEAGEAWNEAVSRAEGATKEDRVRSLQDALVAAARSRGDELADLAGWNWAVSARDMAVQTLAWRAALSTIHEAVAAAIRGENWRRRAEKAGEDAGASLTPLAERIATESLQLFEELVDPPSRDT
jgi:signal transduction histidine kinase